MFVSLSSVTGPGWEGEEKGGRGQRRSSRDARVMSCQSGVRERILGFEREASQGRSPVFKMFSIWKSAVDPQKSCSACLTLSPDSCVQAPTTPPRLSHCFGPSPSHQSWPQTSPRTYDPYPSAPHMPLSPTPTHLPHPYHTANPLPYPSAPPLRLCPTPTSVSHPYPSAHPTPLPRPAQSCPRPPRPAAHTPDPPRRRQRRVHLRCVR